MKRGTEIFYGKPEAPSGRVEERSDGGRAASDKTLTSGWSKRPQPDDC